MAFPISAIPPLAGPQGASVYGRGYIDGLILSNAADADHDITVSIGACRDSTNVVNLDLSAEITKQIDAAWAVGSGAGGLDTGVVAVSTWYHVWAIRHDLDGVVDALFSLSATSPTMPAGYTYKRRIGSVLTNGSSNILAFTQMGDQFLWASSIEDAYQAAVGTAAVTLTISTPPGVKVIPIVGATISKVGAAPAMLISSLDATDVAPDRVNWTNAVAANSQSGFSILVGSQLRTNTSSQIRVRANAASSSYYLQTHGWIDPRGKDAA